MFDKTETLQLKGIAVLIMVYYHSVALNPSVLALPALHAFASRTGNICVVIFAFITIYGLSKKLLNASDSITIKKSYPLFVIKRTAQQQLWCHAGGFAAWDHQLFRVESCVLRQ